MFEDVRPTVKTNHTLLNKVLPQQLENLLAAAWAKLKDAWVQDSAHTGIRFYSNTED